MRTRIVAVCLVSALSTCAAGAVSVTAVQPTEGTAGTEVTIAGSGFGDAKPKVFLRDDASQKLYGLKVLDYQDTSIVAVVRKGVPGVLSLVLRPKGESELSGDTPFTVHAPQPIAVDPPQAARGDSVGVTGRFLGSLKKPRIRVGGKRAKVTAFADDAVTFVVPKKAPQGALDVEVSNGIGNAVLPSALAVAGGSPGGGLGANVIDMTVDGVAYVFRGAGLDGNGSTAAYWYAPTKTVASVEYAILLGFWHQLGGSLPATYTGNPPVQPFFGGPMAWNQIVAGDATTWAMMNADLWEIVVEAEAGNQIGGHFSGTLRHFPLPDKVVDGTFVLTVPSN